MSRAKPSRSLKTTQTSKPQATPSKLGRSPSSSRGRSKTRRRATAASSVPPHKSVNQEEAVKQQPSVQPATEAVPPRSLCDAVLADEPLSFSSMLTDAVGAIAQLPRDRAHAFAEILTASAEKCGVVASEAPDTKPAQPKPPPQVISVQEISDGDGSDSDSNSSDSDSVSASDAAGDEPPQREPAAVDAPPQQHTLSVLDDVKSWTSADHTRFSKKEPKIFRDITIDAKFQRWLGQEEGQKAKSAPDVVRHIRRVIGSLDIGAFNANEPALMVAFFKEDMLAELKDTAYWETTTTWAAKGANALKLWCTWHLDVLATAGGNEEMRSDIAALEKRAKRWAKLCIPQKKLRGQKRKREQADQIKLMADFDQLSIGARQAMLEIERLSNKYEGKTKITFRDSARATTVLGGLCYSVTVGGRDGEWVDVKESQVQRELFELDRNYLIMDEHKTILSMGEAVKYVPPCLKHAFKLCLGLPKYKETALAFRPVQGDVVNMAGLLTVYSGRHLPGCQALGVQLWRKRFVRSLLLVAGVTPENASMIETGNKHALETALKTYFAVTHEEEADICRRAYLAAFRHEPPVWPVALTDAELGAGDLGGGEPAAAVGDGNASDDSLASDLERIIDAADDEAKQAAPLVDEAQASKKHGKPTLFTPEQQGWIRTWVQLHLGADATHLPIQLARDMLAEGRSPPEQLPDVTAKQLQNFCQAKVSG